MSQLRELALLMPVYNDWKSARQLISELEEEKELRAHLSTVFLIDDASTEPAPDGLEEISSPFELKIVRLDRNLGHQRAIFEGLKIVSQLEFKRVLVMDADGEDTPRGASQLVSTSNTDDRKIVVAKRGLREETWSFRVFYRAHKLIFRILVGKRLDFGNFSVLPLQFVQTLVSSGDATTNLSSTILKSGHPLLRVKINKGSRYYGQSKMNFEKLVAHSFSALAVFTDQIMVRLTIFSFFSTLVSGLGVSAVFAIRIFSETVTPGWATAATGLLVIMSIQVLSFVGLGTLISMNLNSMKNYYQNQIDEMRNVRNQLDQK